jgi:NhaP-type Na+/H+ or K+/H+ antiporter
MPLTIVGVALLARGLFGLPIAACVLLGAVLAPTDPVLAADTQSAPPGEDEDAPDPVRTALTTEAGLNDGLAFPFTYLAIAIAILGPSPSEWLVPWALLSVGYKIVVGVLVGWACGWLLAQTFRIAPPKGEVARRVTGSIALPITLLTYGATELVAGYGFIAVFVAACVVRSQELKTHEHRRLHDFAEEIERLVAALLLMMLGAALTGPLLHNVTVMAGVAAAAILLLIRPAAGMVSLIGAPLSIPQRVAVSFLGIRGIGSIYYFAYALNHAEFEGRDLMWAVIALTIVGSIVLHGLTARPIVRWARR